jgi:uncharacterized protein with HEPN domain
MRHDSSYLLDILIAAREARQFVSEITRQQFDQSRLHQNAVIKTLETIGEAASRVSSETIAANPGIPWSEMKGMRNRLIHGYFEVDVAKVWDTVQRDLPLLIAAIEPLVPPEKHDEEKPSPKGLDQ